MKLPRILIDLNDQIGPHSFALICRGTIEDLARQNLFLAEGMRIEVYDSELLATGTVGKTKPLEGWPGAGQWMVEIDPDSWRDYASANEQSSGTSHRTSTRRMSCCCSASSGASSRERGMKHAPGGCSSWWSVA